jgi:nucleotide-binding universal stress UspA family protein
MNQNTEQPSNEIVLVVGLDLTAGSERLLAKARDLVASAGDAELHVVHVVRPEPLRERLGEPIHSGDGPETNALKEAARFELEGLCRRVVENSPVRWTVHVRVGRAADELARVAKEVEADFVVVEAHDRAPVQRLFHRSVVARVARRAPCSVLTIRHPAQSPQSPTQPNWVHAGSR